MLPNVTEEKTPTVVKPYREITFEDWITFLALGGLMISEEDQTIYKMTLSQFCEKFNISKMTISRWRKQTPDLATRIEARRNEIAPMARVTAVYNQLFLSAMQSKDMRAAVDAQKTFLGHFGNLQLPVQRQDIKIQGGLAEVLIAAEREGILEGELVEPSTIDTDPSGQTPGALPPTS